MDELEQMWPDADRREAALTRIQAQLHGQGYRNGGPTPREIVSDKEVAAINALSHGLGHKGAAEILGVSVDAIYRRLRSARTLLAAKDDYHLIAIALRGGLIQ